jgi:hypothetical protein
VPFPKTAAWRRLDLEDGLGTVRVSSFRNGFLAHGFEVGIHTGRPWGVTFNVMVDTEWLTRRFAAVATSDLGPRWLVLECEGSSWARRSGNESTPAPELDGCTDVDIVSTPFTNTLPIRRLGLTVGESADIRAAWVDAPSLEVSVSNQRYTRLEPADGVDRYEFATPDSGETYELTVDDDGIVVDYERFARRIAPREGA